VRRRDVKKTWTFAKLDREARKVSRKTGMFEEARAALIALRGVPDR
jgi:hypothetical protein